MKTLGLAIGLATILMLALGLVRKLWGAEVAQFLDYLVVAGILAYGIVRRFFA